MHELKQPFNIAEAKKFLHVSLDVDNLRKENIFKVIPELQVIQDMFPR
jgi:hypothetical protein